MASTEQVIERLRESKPPATDRFTYLTIMDKSLSPDVLPGLEEILEDVELTSDIGWDLVEMLIAVPGSEKCLESVARLGNPREVILKTLQVMEATSGKDEDNSKFVTLCGMLGLLHRRLQVKTPSRFLHTTLETVYRCYDGTSAEATAAVISLIHAVSGQKRPPLPTRQSSTTLVRPFKGSEAAKSAPDPEADDSDRPGAKEAQVMELLLQSFVTCVIEAYVNSNSLEWAPRLLEYMHPDRIVPGKKTAMQAFKESDQLRARDALIGQLVAAAGDLGLSKASLPKLQNTLSGPICRDVLSIDFDAQKPQQIKLSTGGLICLVAYCIFAAQIFDADQPQPDLYMFPHHEALLEQFLGKEDPQTQIANNPGTVESLVVLGMWLMDEKRISCEASSQLDFMGYHHLVTLMAVFHGNIGVRNAATTLAGQVLHVDPDEDDRLNILEDLLENCMFTSLQACAVAWLREEMIAAKEAKHRGRFSSPECLESLQYTLFPSMAHLHEADKETLLEFWTQSAPLLLQVANFGLFLYGSGSQYKELAPAGMAAAIEHRFVEPLLQAAKRLSEKVAQEGGVERQDAEAGVLMQLDILTDTLGRIPLQ
ncbi:hypothetical protein CDD81_2624 [Ophiocordyceps australis]|uniref:DUF1760-domain-containing protein n=1 Tax=Ophiocordyceps australis TaxID=1399860 RepID=A0A2C5XX86_9HYPO|nr:hypothetical protein CDD81_2624 [Ophiocordyceps australis]